MNFRIVAGVQGRVQGVSFRYYTRQVANRLGLTGWVRNEADSSVALEAEGDKTNLQQLIDFLHQGPPAAQVTDVHVSWEQSNGKFNEFRVLY